MWIRAHMSKCALVRTKVRACREAVAYYTCTRFHGVWKLTENKKKKEKEKKQNRVFFFWVCS